MLPDILLAALPIASATIPAPDETVFTAEDAEELKTEVTLYNKVLPPPA